MATSGITLPVHPVDLTPFRQGDAAERAAVVAAHLDPIDPVARYRQARLLIAQRDEAGALALLDTIKPAAPAK